MPFWDIVVITASDAAQQLAYQQQINEKQSRRELPLDLPIHVVSDPPGVRIGNGGSTLISLEFLQKVYGVKVFELKILLIQAGGWSQRMPSAAVLGKVFSILPHGNPPFQMLDLKLALYWPFVERMQPGVFLVCADDFVIFDLNGMKEWKIPAKGFTALAHPAPLALGKSHGVFVLAQPLTLDTSEPVSLCDCLKVLQKPSESRMKLEGAPLKGNSFSFGDGIKLEGEVVYTDSCFYFGVDVMRKLIDMKKSMGNLSCEIDAYGDFLQAVGKNATNDYINLTFNVSQPTPNLLETRQRVFDTLNGSDIHVLALNSSKFIHIGTTKELLHHFCQDDEFQEQLCMGKAVFNLWENDNDNEGKLQVEKENIARSGLSENTCIIHCSLHHNSKVGSDCFLEFCHFEVPATVLSNCIVSNCEVSLREFHLESICVPSHTFLHTVPILQNGQTVVEYVTIFFLVGDDLKKSVGVKEIASLPFLGSDIGTFLSQQGLAIEDILPCDIEALSQKKNSSEAVDFNGKGLNNKVSLWNLKIYKAYHSMTSSFEASLGVLNNCDQHIIKKPRLSPKYYSMSELFKTKDVSAMLKYRRDLYEKIVQR